MMNRRAGLALIVGASAVLTGCDEWGDWGSSDRYREDFSFTKRLRPGGRLSLETMNGAVEITTHAGDTVEVTGTKYASTKDALQALEIESAEADGSLHIRTIRPSGFRGGMGARYTIRVPRKVELDRIVTSNARIMVDGVQGTTRLRTSNGSVHVAGVRGPIEVETTNAAVELKDNDGPVIVRTTNGHIDADEVKGSLSATTTNASVSARLLNAEQGRPVTIATTNGEVTLTLDGLRGNPVTASTTNASITVKLPASVGARLSAETTNSSVSTDFDITMRGAISKTKIHGDINGGGAPITLATTNGRVNIQRL
ncbi:MAG TPA: DUF4097 family beta strand repeat-containing protein [Bryobacteraceae bacterium]|nr:DUF4097 family beta strand repeat-containing protein [Bryobacteraceae bacterium]